jgi:thioredoxin reductase (NADPH)
LAASVSEYLVSRIDAVPQRITLHRTTEITALHGDRHLEQVTWTNRATGEEQTRRVAGIFLMLGAAPNTEWLGGALALDARGFVLTGAAPRRARRRRPRSPRACPASSPWATSAPGRSNGSRPRSARAPS